MTRKKQKPVEPPVIIARFFVPPDVIERANQGSPSSVPANRVLMFEEDAEGTVCAYQIDHDGRSNQTPLVPPPGADVNYTDLLEYLLELARAQ